MAREELIKGIRMAVKKGETLRDAMMSFYNAGYKKEDIEEAAREVYSEMEYNKEEPSESKQTTKRIEEVKKDVPFAPTTNQKVSEYSYGNKVNMGFAKKILLILLFIFLLIIGGFIVALVLFKEEFLSTILGV